MWKVTRVQRQARCPGADLAQAGGTSPQRPPAHPAGGEVVVGRVVAAGWCAQALSPRGGSWRWSRGRWPHSRPGGAAVAALPAWRVLALESWLGPHSRPGGAAVAAARSRGHGACVPRTGGLGGGRTLRPPGLAQRGLGGHEVVPSDWGSGLRPDLQASLAGAARSCGHEVVPSDWGVAVAAPQACRIGA